MTERFTLIYIRNKAIADAVEYRTRGRSGVNCKYEAYDCNYSFIPASWIQSRRTNSIIFSQLLSIEVL